MPDSKPRDPQSMSFGLFQREQRSLFGEILDWMLTPLLLLWPLSLALTWIVAQGIASKPFDRALEFNLQALTQLVVVEQGQLRFTLDTPTRELLRADDTDLMYYQVRNAKGNRDRLVALPEQDIHLPRNWREREVQQKAWFKAVPGYGQRPDFIVRMGDVWVRSLEGRDADSTFYLVSAPFTCSDQVANRDGYSAEPVRVPAGSCREAYVGQRVYQVRGDAPPRDVTAEAMPAMPQVTEADRARQLAREGRITLDHSKLQFGPAMRWFVQYPETVPKGGARAFSDWNREHLAFVVWTGDRFELRDKVPRSQWPCDPVAPGDRACGGFPDSGPDLFVTASASAPVAATSP